MDSKENGARKEPHFHKAGQMPTGYAPLSEKRPSRRIRRGLAIKSRQLGSGGRFRGFLSGSHFDELFLSRGILGGDGAVGAAGDHSVGDAGGVDLNTPMTGMPSLLAS